LRPARGSSQAANFGGAGPAAGPATLGLPFAFPWPSFAANPLALRRLTPGTSCFETGENGEAFRRRRQADARMNVMPAPSSQNQWYLARDGQQYGPLTDPELAKFVELGHLQPTDLLWREGFAEWRPALAVFPPQGPGAAGRKEANAKPTGAPLPAPLAA